MKKVIYECVGNSILFALMGLTLIHPFSEFCGSFEGFSAVTSALTFIFIIYLILFAGIRFFVFRDGKKRSIIIPSYPLQMNEKKPLYLNLRKLHTRF